MADAFAGVTRLPVGPFGWGPGPIGVGTVLSDATGCWAAG